MTWPREGSRETGEGIIISVPMDWCKSPTAIVPYKIWAYQREAMNLANTVRQTSDPTHVKDSIVLKCYGDEAGVGGGVISGTHNAECTPKTWSDSVFAQGRNVVRHDDEWWMNHKNTWGKLHYVKDPNAYPATSAATLIPKMTPPDASLYQASYTEAGSSASTATQTGQQQAQLFEMPFEIAPEVEPYELPPGEIPGGPKIGPEPEPKPLPMPRPLPDPGMRTTGKCRPITVCFKSNGKDAEYKRQLKFQQDALNAKTSCKAAADIQAFDDKTAAQKQAQRALANRAKIPFVRGWTAANPGVSTANLDALHRLDMVAGGNPTDFADMGDSSVNQSIGPEWNAETRKGALKRYAEEMCDKKCPMAVTLDLCDELPAGGVWA